MVSYGGSFLPPGTDNYGSCAEAETEIDTEISRLLGKNILGTWAAVAAVRCLCKMLGLGSWRLIHQAPITVA